MRRAKFLSARLAMVGLSLTWFGCGGGNKEETASDTPVANETAPAADSGEAPAPAPGGKAEGALLARNDAAPAAAAEPAPGPAVAPKGDASATTELLNLANTATPPADAAPAKDAAAAGSGGPPGSSSAPSGYPGAPGAPGGGGPPGVPGGDSTASGPPNGGAADSMRPPAGYPGIGGGSGGPPGSNGFDSANAGGGSGGAAMDGMTGPADHRTPIGGARSFLSAVKAKDKEKIADSTALRSPQEASTENMKKLFSTIVDQTISDDSVNELARAFEGYQIIGTNQAKSSGKLGVILQKSNNKGGILRRTITVRKEAKGWKVEDISGVGEIEGMRRAMPKTTTPKRN